MDVGQQRTVARTNVWKPGQLFGGQGECSGARATVQRPERVFKTQGNRSVVRANVRKPGKVFDLHNRLFGGVTQYGLLQDSRKSVISAQQGQKKANMAAEHSPWLLNGCPGF